MAAAYLTNNAAPNFSANVDDLFVLDEIPFSGKARRPLNAPSQWAANIHKNATKIKNWARNKIFFFLFDFDNFFLQKSQKHFLSRLE